MVLPQPDSPTRPNASPRRIWKLTSSTACTCEVALPKKFVSAAKRFVRCWTSSRISCWGADVHVRARLRLGGSGLVPVALAHRPASSLFSSSSSSASRISSPASSASAVSTLRAASASACASASPSAMAARNVETAEALLAGEEIREAELSEEAGR